MCIAVITARGGSRRIPRKNIRTFMGRPMLAWPIAAARAAGIFSRIIVSTDDAEIAAVARDCGAETPFVRPAELSDDHTPTAPVFEHALRWARSEGLRPRYACCIYPTAPFLEAHDLVRGLEALQTHGAPAAVAVTTYDFPVLRAFRVQANGTLAFNWPEYALARSQDLPDFLHDAGQFYWVDVDCFLASHTLVMPGCVPVRLPRNRVQDMDTPEDWDVAEGMARARCRAQGS